MRKWIGFFAFSLGFSLQIGLAGVPTFQPSEAALPAPCLPPVTFSFNCIDGQPGDTVCMPVTVTNFNDIVIAQFEIVWNSDVLDYIEVTNPGTNGINVNSDFNLSGPNALRFIPLNFDPFVGETLPDGTVLFEVCFRIIGYPGSTSPVGISPYFAFEVADIVGVVPSDSASCTMTVNNAVNLVGFVTSCGAASPGGDGSIDVTIYGGTSPYTITGIPGGPYMIPVEGGSASMNVPAGNYNILITDAVGGTASYNIDVDTLALSIDTRLKDPTCYKINNGTMWIKPIGGSAPYSFIWQGITNPNLAGSGFIRNVGDSSLVTSLPDGMYSILVKDNHGCVEQITVQLIDKPFMFTIANLKNATCNGSIDGVIDLHISGGTPAPDGTYTIKWTAGQFSSDQISIGLLNPGTYSITVQDESIGHCDTVYTFTIGSLNIITANVTPTDAKCSGSDDGSVSIQGLTNGVPGASYSYSIFDHGILVTSQNNIVGTFNYSPLAPGDYMIIVHENACASDSIPFSISEPLPIMISVVGSTLDNCLPFSGSGKVWFQITNGTAPYILSAGSGMQVGDSLIKVNSGNYIATVTDFKGCKATVPFVMHQGDFNEKADITFQIDGTPCEGGTVTVLYQGNPLLPGVGVVWTNDSTTATIPILETDTLGVTVLLGAPVFCILNDTVIVHCAKKLDLDITVVQPLCNDEAVGGPYTGTVIVDTMNATAPVTWIWSIPDTTQSGIYAGLSPGRYYVTVTDAADSIAIDSFDIIAPNAIHFGFGIPDSTSCISSCDGEVQVIPQDGDPTLDYFLYWTTTVQNADTNVFFQVQNLCAGFTEFSVSQDGICFYKDSIEILSPTAITVDTVMTKDATCHGDSDGSIQVIATGGSPGYTYTWQGGPSSPTFSGIAAGKHFVTVKDSHNCTQTDSFSISEPETLIAQIDSFTLNLSCGSSNDGIITIDVSGGNDGPYSFLWNPDVSSVYQAVNLAAGQYLITVTDRKGCSDTTAYSLSSPPPIVTTWPEVLPPECFGDETVLQINQVTGGNGNYSFNINGGQLLDIGDPVLIPSGIYIVSVFDDRGCSDDTTYTIMEPNPILVSIGPDDPIIELGDSLFIIGHVDQSDNQIEMTRWTSTSPIGCDTCAGTWVFNFLPTIYTWTVTDENGCQGSASITVDVDFNRHVFMPNAFTPNRDGRNDEFKIFTGPGVEAINYFHIYDRWGNLVHSETGLLPDPAGAGKWDGTYNGEPLSPGVYVYVAEVSFIDNHTTLVYRGDVTLIK